MPPPNSSKTPSLHWQSLDVGPQPASEPRVASTSLDPTSTPYTSFLAFRRDIGTVDTGDVAIGVAVPGIALLCAGATLLYLILREARRRKAGASPYSGGFLAFLFRRKQPIELGRTTPDRVTDSLVLRRLDTYRFIAAPPRRRVPLPLPEMGSVDGEQMLHVDTPAGPSTDHRRRPEPGLSRASDRDPFSDAHVSRSPAISRPPSAIIGSRVSLNYDGVPIHWDPAASISSDPFHESEDAVEVASTPGSASVRTPSFIGSTALSEHALAFTESTPPTPGAASDDLGYLSDTTMSTLPPSYRTRRPNIPRTPPPPIPASTSSFDTITAPPSAFTTRNRRRSLMHGPRPPSGARQQGGPTVQRFALADGQVDSCGAPEEASRERTGERTTRRKSEDGGVRLAGGPLEPSREDGMTIDDGSSELDPPPMYQEPRCVPKEKMGVSNPE